MVHVKDESENTAPAKPKHNNDPGATGTKQGGRAGSILQRTEAETWGKYSISQLRLAHVSLAVVLMMI